MPDSNRPDEPPVHLPLDYAGPPLRGGRPGTGIEAVLGFVTYVAFLGGLIAAWAAGFQKGFPQLALIGLGLLAVLATYLHACREWRGFAAGLAIGFGLSCLFIGGGIGYVVYTCKGI